MKHKKKIEFLESIIRQLEIGILLHEENNKIQADSFRESIKMYQSIIEVLKKCK